MLARDRKKLILQDIITNNIVKVDELSKKYNVSVATIRRDLNELENKKLLNRIHGGATSLELITREPDYLYRKDENLDIKFSLGKEAINLLEDDMLVFLDAGTTIYEFTKIILNKDFKNLTLITNDVNTAYLIHKSKKNKLLLVGGNVYSGDGHIQGSFSNYFIENLYPEISFIGTSSIDGNLNMFTPDENKIYQKRSLIKNSNTSVMIADSSKFDKKSIYKIANLNEFDYLITDYCFSSQQLNKVKNLKVINI